MAANEKTVPAAPAVVTDAEKTANFKRRAVGYVNGALDSVIRLGDLSVSRTVLADPESVKKAFSAIREACDTAEARFSSPKATKTGFSL